MAQNSSEAAAIELLSNPNCPSSADTINTFSGGRAGTAVQRRRSHLCRRRLRFGRQAVSCLLARSAAGGPLDSTFGIRYSNHGLPRHQEPNLKAVATRAKFYN